MEVPISRDRLSRPGSPRLVADLVAVNEAVLFVGGRGHPSHYQAGGTAGLHTDVTRGFGRYIREGPHLWGETVTMVNRLITGMVKKNAHDLMA